MTPDFREAVDYALNGYGSWEISEPYDTEEEANLTYAWIDLKSLDCGLEVSFQMRAWGEFVDWAYQFDMCEDSWSDMSELYAFLFFELMKKAQK